MPWFGGGRVEKEQAIDTSPAVYPTCGDRSNMKKSICMSIPHRKRHAPNCRAISNFTITNGFIKHWSTKPQLKCIFRNGRNTRIEAMSFEKEQEESSS